MSSQVRLSSVSVVFDFNDSLNDSAPAFPMLLSVDTKTKGETRLCLDMSLTVVLYLYELDRVR